jgi:competence protein ComEC
VPATLWTLRYHTILTLAALAVLFGSIGWWRGTAYVQKLEVHKSFHLRKVTVVGHATDEAVYGKRQQLEFVLTNVTVLSPHPTPLVGNVTVRGFGEPMVYRGDTVQVTGKLYPTLGNNLASIGFADLDILARGTSRLDVLRREFAAGTQSALPEPLASFALGLLIGQRTTLPAATEEQLRQTGLTHIIAVSGYNLTVIVMACRRLLAKRSKFQATAACIGLMAVFLLLTGFSPPIVRASIISLLGIAAWYYGRQVKPLVLLLTGAAITVVANPLYLWGNVSWYLSFLAFFGVLVVAPLVTKRFMGTKEPRVLTSILIESTCASICVLPYILYVFGQASLVSLLANMLVVPLIPIAMLLGLGAGLAGMLLTPLAGWFAWPAKLLLTYMLDIASLLSRVPHAFVEDIGFPLPAMLLAYGLLGCTTWILWRKTRYIRGSRRN